MPVFVRGAAIHPLPCSYCNTSIYALACSRSSGFWPVNGFVRPLQWQTRPVALQVAAPGVITPDSELVVRGEGMPRTGGARRGDRGDLRVRFKIAFPQRLSPLQLAHLQAVLG